MPEMTSDAWAKYMESSYWLEQLPVLTQKGMALLFILAFTWILLKVRQIILRRIFRLARMDEKQKNTLESLLLSFTRYVAFIIAFIMVLSTIGIEIGPLIAGAGVLGLAIGFGAQTLVKDLITGFFIIFEDQFSVGDYVTINNGEINGTVVSVGLRATKIRTWAQHVVVIQNSEIRVSQNYNRERMRAIVYFTVPYEIDPAEVEHAIHIISDDMIENNEQFFLKDDQGNILEAPRLYGITDIENSALGAKYAVICLTTDAHYWTACNTIRKKLVQQFSEQGIQFSYPRRIERLEPESL